MKQALVTSKLKMEISSKNCGLPRKPQLYCPPSKNRGHTSNLQTRLWSCLLKIYGGDPDERPSYLLTNFNLIFFKKTFPTFKNYSESKQI